MLADVRDLRAGARIYGNLGLHAARSAAPRLQRRPRADFSGCRSHAASPQLPVSSVVYCLTAFLNSSPRVPRRGPRG